MSTGDGYHSDEWGNLVRVPRMVSLEVDDLDSMRTRRAIAIALRELAPLFTAEERDGILRVDAALLDAEDSLAVRPT